MNAHVVAWCEWQISKRIGPAMESLLLPQATDLGYFDRVWCRSWQYRAAREATL